MQKIANGTKVWVNLDCSTAIECTVCDFHVVKRNGKEFERYQVLSKEPGLRGIYSVREKQVHLSEKEALEAYRAEMESVKEKYRSECQNWKSLVSFCIQHMRNAELPNYEAIEVAEEMLERLYKEA